MSKAEILAANPRIGPVVSWRVSIPPQNETGSQRRS
jgi:hypothetical protein